MGADDAVHVEIPDNALGGPLEPLGVSKILHEVIKKSSEEEEVGLVIMGKQAIDDDASQTGQMLAAKLGWPQATFASKLEFLGKLDKGEEVQVTREVDGGLAVVKSKLPIVLTTDLRLNGEYCDAWGKHQQALWIADFAQLHILRAPCLPRRAPLRLPPQHHEGQEEALQEVHPC